MCGGRERGIEECALSWESSIFKDMKLRESLDCTGNCKWFIMNGDKDRGSEVERRQSGLGYREIESWCERRLGWQRRLEITRGSGDLIGLTYFVKKFVILKLAIIWNKMWIPVFTPLFTSFMTLSKLLKLSELQVF